MPSVRFWPRSGGAQNVLFRAAFGGKVGMEEACCCPFNEIGTCSLCVDNQAWRFYALDLVGTVVDCCNVENWDTTYIVDLNGPGSPVPGMSSIGCTTPPGGACVGTCTPTNINATQCIWINEFDGASGLGGTTFLCFDPDPGDPVEVVVNCRLALVQRTSDSKYFWVARFFGSAGTCAVTAWFISDPMDNKPDCITLPNTTLNFLCQSHDPGFTFAMDFSAATVTLRLP